MTRASDLLKRNNLEDRINQNQHAARIVSARSFVLVGITTCLTYIFTVSFHTNFLGGGSLILNQDDFHLDHRHFAPQFDTRSLFPPFIPQADANGDSLADLDNLSPKECEGILRRVDDVHIPESHILEEGQRIPRIVFQTSKSRCLTPLLHKNANRWKQEGWSYYFYDDDAVMRLFSEHFDEFPFLRGVAYNCMDAGAMKADVWRYLVLYKYGGIYADVDSGFTPDFDWEGILKHDAWMVVDVAYLPSQYFIAVSPRHPLMYYAVHHAILTLLRAPDTGLVHIAHGTGPWALFRAFRSFRQDAGVYKMNMPPFLKKGKSPIIDGTWPGTHGRTVTFAGLGGYGESGKLIIRERVIQQVKQAMFERMGMSHHWKDQKKMSGRLCVEAMTMMGHMPDFSLSSRAEDATTSTSSSSGTEKTTSTGHFDLNEKREANSLKNFLKNVNGAKSELPEISSQDTDATIIEANA